MPLPKIENRMRVLSTNLPSSGKKVSFRQMLVSEEKILMTAKDSGEDGEILSSVKQIVNNCVISEMNIDDIPLFDLEWLYVQIYKNSVSSVVEVAYIDQTDKKRYPFEIDLTKVEVIKEKVDNVVSVVDDVSLELKWPTADDIMDPALKDAPENQMALILGPKVIHRVFDGNSVIVWKDQPEKEREEFFNSISTETFQKIIDYLAKMPRLNYKIEYVNSNGEEREIVLSNLTDFFQF